MIKLHLEKLFEIMFELTASNKGVWEKSQALNPFELSRSDLDGFFIIKNLISSTKEFNYG